MTRGNYCTPGNDTRINLVFFLLRQVVVGSAAGSRRGRAAASAGEGLPIITHRYQERPLKRRGMTLQRFGDDQDAYNDCQRNAIVGERDEVMFADVVHEEGNDAPCHQKGDGEPDRQGQPLSV